jgi:hypothetical protein
MEEINILNKKLKIVEKQDFNHQLAEDIIDQNCCDCLEFTRPLSMSACLCMPVQEIIDQELYRIDDCTEDHESDIAAEWEGIRNIFVNGNKTVSKSDK